MTNIINRITLRIYAIIKSAREKIHDPKRGTAAPSLSAVFTNRIVVLAITSRKSRGSARNSFLRFDDLNAEKFGGSRRMIWVDYAATGRSNP